MRVLMLGWEFPPFSMGGLGTACSGLTKGLTNQGTDVIFVLPRLPYLVDSHVKLIPAIDSKRIVFHPIKSLLVPYMTSQQYTKTHKLSSKLKGLETIYGHDLYQEVFRFTMNVRRIAREESFDIIHCHDWMTFLAGIAAKNISGKPLIVQIHATEFDRTGGNGVNKIVYGIEKQGMQAADAVVAVSNFTKNKISEHYGIPEEKIFVVHNAVELKEPLPHEDFGIRKTDKIVLFLGRITLQKGPDYFVKAAQKVLECESNVKFVVVGSGDMTEHIINLVADAGIAGKFVFSGHMTGKDIDRAYKMADVYVMPSVSEPFGITPLESMRNGTPVIISKQSGVSEVIKNALKVDFWDTDEIANKILAVLRYRSLKTELKEQGLQEVSRFNWNEPAAKLILLYKSAIGEGVHSA